MSNRAVIDADGVVINIIVAGPEFEIPGHTLVEATSGAVIGGTYADGVFAPPPEPAPTVDDVIAERERRLALGFDFDFDDVRGVHRIGTTSADMVGWDEVTKWMQAKLARSELSASLLILTETGPASVTPTEWADILDAATTFRQPIWAASFALQAMDPIPQDFMADSYWEPQP